MSEIRPNRTHYSIVELVKMGKLDFLISQNVDNLHLASGIPQEMIGELHGNHALMKCLECDNRLSFTEAGWDKSICGEGYRTHKLGKGQPVCPKCKGRLMSSVVNFGDPMPEKEIRISMERSKTCDVFMVIGSSLVVTPAANMPSLALDNGAKLIIINQGETPYDDVAHLRFWENAGMVMEDIVNGLNRIVT
jgi:NAD-dependent deacetylase